jgi:hypothetical protein
VPFKGQAQFIPGYRGLITLAMNSGMVSEIWAKEVRQADHFVVHEGTKHEIEHHVDYTKSRRQRGEIIAVYACAHLKNGGKVFEIMPADEVEEIRQQAPGANSPAWKNHWPEMAKKTVLRRLAKWLPQSVQRYTQMEEHFEATGEVTHLSNDLTIEASKTDYSEVPAEDQSQEEQPTQPQRQQSNGGQQASNGNGQGQKKQSSRARAAVGESRKKSNGQGQQKQQRQPQAQENESDSAPAQQEQPADDTPHDPDTGEVVEATAMEVSGEDEASGWDNDVGAEEATDSGGNDDVDTSAVEMPYGKRGPDIDGWFNQVIEKLNSYTHAQQVERFRQACKGEIDLLANLSKQTADEAHKLFDDRIQEINENSPF